MRDLLGIKAAILFTVLSVFFLFGPTKAYGSAAVGVPVLLYHHIVEEDAAEKENGAVVPLSEFEGQMKALYERGYYTASLEELADFVYGRGELPERSVVITFDDGYLSNYTLAFPVLQRYGFKAAIFPIGSLIPAEDAKEDGERPAHFSFGQMKAMAKSGLIEFGSHTYDFHKAGESGDGLLGKSSEEIAEDLGRFNGVLEDEGISYSPCIAYPMGKYDEGVLGAAREAGYVLGFTVEKGFVYRGSAPMALNRIIVFPGTGVGKFLASVGDRSQILPEGFADAIVIPVGGTTAYIMGKPYTVGTPAFLRDRRIMVPLRFAAEALGAKVSWSAGSVFVEGASGETVRLDILPSGSFGREAVAGDKVLTMDVPPVMAGGTTMVPARFLSEALGFSVIWHPEANMVEIRR